MKPRLRRSSPVVLAIVAAVGLVLGRSVRLVVEGAGAIAPSVPWASPIVLFFLAVVLGERAWATYRAVHRDRLGIEPVDGVRLLALAKACALGGVFIAGLYLGYALSFAGDMEAALPRERVLRSAVAFVASACVVAAAVLLERACEVPTDDDDDTEGSPPRNGSVA